MMPMDTLTCVLVPNAIKNDSLSCSMPPLEYLDLFTTVGSVATALFTLALVSLAWWAGLTAVKTLKQTRKDSIERTRPYVYAQIVPSLAGTSVYDLIIKNSGQSTASNLVIRCPEFPSKPDDIADKVGILFDMKHTLPPGTQIRCFWRLELERGARWADGTSDPAGMPSKASIAVSYQGSDGRYEEIFPVDTSIFALAPVPASGHDVPATLTDAEKDLHKMLAVIARNIRELGRHT